MPGTSHWESPWDTMGLAWRHLNASIKHVSSRSSISGHHRGAGAPRTEPRDPPMTPKDTHGPCIQRTSGSNLSFIMPLEKLQTPVSTLRQRDRDHRASSKTKFCSQHAIYGHLSETGWETRKRNTGKAHLRVMAT